MFEFHWHWTWPSWHQPNRKPPAKNRIMCSTMDSLRDWICVALIVLSTSVLLSAYPKVPGLSGSWCAANTELLRVPIPEEPRLNYLTGRMSSHQLPFESTGHSGSLLSICTNLWGSRKLANKAVVSNFVEDLRDIELDHCFMHKLHIPRLPCIRHLISLQR